MKVLIDPCYPEGGHKLVIAEIPDGVQFIVVEPDSSNGEIIVEGHRVWTEHGEVK